MDAYRAAYDSARPDPGRDVVRLTLDCRETDWSFVAGQTTRAWSFNDSIPGPAIEAKVGDVVEVHLTNSLSDPTVLHWHGLRIPSSMDGTEMVQRPILPGQTFEYRFRVADAGTFWYHPHLDETVQIERGLYGAFVVRGDDEPQLDGERVLVLADVELDDQGQMKRPGWRRGSNDDREAGVRLVNGRQEPELTIQAGRIERWRIVNAAGERYIRLSIGGLPFRILGTDGGLLSAPHTATEVLLVPADRVDLAVGPFEEGKTLRIEALPFDRGRFQPPSDPELFATLRVGPGAPSRAVVPATLRSIEPLTSPDAIPNREVLFDWRRSAEHGVQFTINKELHHRADPVSVGELQVWEIVNQSPADHPFHLHGFFFQVLQVNGRPPDFLSWEDTVNVPAKGRVRIAWVPDERPGEWMYHCHILEHHAAGMMAHFDVLR